MWLIAIESISLLQYIENVSNKSEQNQVLNQFTHTRTNKHIRVKENHKRRKKNSPSPPPAKWSIIYLCKHDVNERVRGKYKQISVSFIRVKRSFSFTRERDLPFTCQHLWILHCHHHHNNHHHQYRWLIYAVRVRSFVVRTTTTTP